MIENDIKVSNEELAENWFNTASDSLEAIENTIDFLNKIYEFNLYDIKENLSSDKINLKTNIKYTNICTPLAYIAELFLKSIIISYMIFNDEFIFSRENAVKMIMKQVRSQSKTNGHNLTTLIEYINNNIDEYFKIDLARVYVEHRKHAISKTCRMEPISRITLVNNLYENAFINARYLYETKDTLNESIDLVKLLDYVNTLRDCCFYQLLKINLSKIPRVKQLIKKYYNEYYKDNEIFKESNISIIINELLRYIDNQYYNAYPNKDYPDIIKKELLEIKKIKFEIIDVHKYLHKTNKSNEKLSKQTKEITTIDITEEIYGKEYLEPKIRTKIK